MNNARDYPEILLANEEQRAAFYHPPLELYDLDADPSELSNLAEDPVHRDTLHRLAGALREWMAQTGDLLLDGPIPQGAYVQRIKRFKTM